MMKYGPNPHDYDTQSIFEIVELINHDMEDDFNVVFYHALDPSVSVDKNHLPHIEWAMINNETLKLAKIGEYKADDVSFFKRFMKAHRELFEGKLKEAGMKKPQLDKFYERWYNKGLRHFPDVLSEDGSVLVGKKVPRSTPRTNSANPRTGARDEVRRFELVNKKHRKFWTIQKLAGGRARTFTVVFGRIPEGPRPFQLEYGRGQVQTKTFKTAAACNEAYEKLLEEKRKKGYRETLHTFVHRGPPAVADSTYLLE